MNAAETIGNSLRRAFQPQILEVVNESYKHSGHAGDDGTGETHFHIRISAAAFAGKSRVARERSLRQAITAANIDPHAVSFEFV